MVEPRRRAERPSWCRFRFCSLKRRIRLSHEHRVLCPLLCTCETSPGFHICPLECFSYDESHATPRACRAMIASTPIVGASSLDSATDRSTYHRPDSADCAEVRSDSIDAALASQTPCACLSRFTLGKRVDVRVPGKLRSWRPGFGVWDLLYGPRKRA